MSTRVRKTTRRSRGPRATRLLRPDLPFTMRLPDGRTLFVEVPGRWVTTDRSGEPAFLPEAVRFLDRVHALAVSALDRAPSPGYVTALRQGLGLTQKELGEQVGVDKITVSRWERGELRPSAASLASLERVRKQAVRKGVTLPG